MPCCKGECRLMSPRFKTIIQKYTLNSYHLLKRPGITTFILSYFAKLIIREQSSNIINPKGMPSKHAPNTPIACDDSRSSEAQLRLRTELDNVDF